MNLTQHLQALNWLGGINGAAKVAEQFGAAEMVGPSPVTDGESGALFVLCGGEVLMAFHRVDKMRGCAYVVRDSFEHDAWLVKRHSGENVTGSCPRAFLKMVYCI